MQIKDYCQDCEVKGDCCHVGEVKDGKKRYYLPRIKCKWLGHDNRCTIYNFRHIFAPWCLDMKEYSKIDGAPKDCGYQEHYDFKFPHVGDRKISELEERALRELHKETIQKKGEGTAPSPDQTKE